MKVFFILFILTILPFFILFERKGDRKSKSVYLRGSGTAILITGAAARIPQQAAMLEELYNRGLLNNVVFISGVSAGALNSVILNMRIKG